MVVKVLPTFAVIFTLTELPALPPFAEVTQRAADRAALRRFGALAL
jgi:hypothetical protein